ncbi:MAG: MotA/TolQ/ExbB proton channel family protein [Deltaproteobacteria bacterium]|nr:MotA/TolQ/ExbB proton channel family protein [Deltaproteobacteria bacterium]
MDFATILGILSGIALIFGAIASSSGVAVFVNVPSMMIVLGGTLASTLISFPLKDVVHSFRAAGQVFRQRNINPNEVVRLILTLANLSRRQGLVALSKVRTDSSVLKKALMLIADGAPDSMIRETVRIEINSMVQRHSVAQEVFRKMGTYAPAFGMLGTLIGLVQMLNALDDPKSIGPKMAVALITTFYGSFLSSLFFLPIAGKLKTRTAVELINLEIIFEGALSILDNNNPLLIYEKLSSFIPPKLREEYNPEKSRSAERE